jgi:hypothetical protein
MNAEETLEKVRYEIAALFAVPSAPTFDQAINVCRNNNAADARCLLSAMNLLNEAKALSPPPARTEREA